MGLLDELSRDEVEAVLAQIGDVEMVRAVGRGDYRLIIERVISLSQGPLTIVDQDVDLVSLIQWAVGLNNLRGVVDERINQANFLSVGKGVQRVALSVEPCDEGKLLQTEVRRVGSSYHLPNVRELAVYLHDHRQEIMEKWHAVFAVGEMSRFCPPGHSNNPHVPYVWVVAPNQCNVGLYPLRIKCQRRYGILVAYNL